MLTVATMSWVAFSCVHVCVCICSCSRRKTVWAINTKVRRDI